MSPTCRQAGARGRRSDPRALSVVLAGEVAPGTGVAVQLQVAAQSGPSPAGLFEMQILGSHTDLLSQNLHDNSTTR